MLGAAVNAPLNELLDYSTVTTTPQLGLVKLHGGKWELGWPWIWTLRGTSLFEQKRNWSSQFYTCSVVVMVRNSDVSI